jgi:hypothetical protein
MATITEKELAGYLRSGFSVLLEGKHGTGKTAMVQAACETLGWKLKSFTVSLMDPYIDLVGVPVPRTGPDGREVLTLVRPRDIEDADVIFLDELNRGELKTLNAVLELVQFGSINGEKLPKLKAVVAAQNPAGDIYDTIELDQALVDRFDIFLEVKPAISIPFFTATFNRDVAQAVAKWYRERGAKADYISPRRMEKLCHLYNYAPTRRSLEAAMPPNGTYEVGKLHALLQEATEDPKEKRARLAREKAAVALQTKKEKEAAEKKAEAMRERMKNLHSVPVKDARRIVKTGDVAELVTYLNSGDAGVETTKDALVSILGDQVSPNDLMGRYAAVLGTLGDARIRKMSNRWSAPKLSQFKGAVYNAATKDKSLKTRDDVLRSPYWEADKMFVRPGQQHPLQFMANRRPA